MKPKNYEVESARLRECIQFAFLIAHFLACHLLIDRSRVTRVILPRGASESTLSAAKLKNVRQVARLSETTCQLHGNIMRRARCNENSQLKRNEIEGILYVGISTQNSIYKGIQNAQQ